jgi:transcriptional regulator with XRE-family HTH domain
MAKLKDLDVEITDWTKANAGARMKAFLVHVRKNQMQAAIFLGVSVTTISRWCNGHHIPDFRTRRTIQNILEAR